MSNAMEYKGYRGIVEFSATDSVFYGKVFGINDLVTFEGETVRQLKSSFREAVDDYILTCKSLGKNPERPYKGTFNVRIPPETHRKAALVAQASGISLNELVERAIEVEVSRSKAIEEKSLTSRSAHRQRKAKTAKSSRAMITRKRKISKTT